jgi:hypothetical protein
MSAWERISLFAAGALIGLPAANLAIAAAVHKTNSGVVWLLLALTAIAGYYYLRPVVRVPRQELVGSWPLIAAAACQIALIVAIFTAYQALPDVDPYHWIKAYQQQFADAELSVLPQRPLFHALVHILATALPLMTEQIFKFALPLLSLVMLIPAWLVARRLPDHRQQLLLLLYPSISPSLIISAQMGTPQAVLITVMAFFIFFLLYAHLTKQQIWHYAAGAIVLIGSLIHGLAFFLFVLWLAATAWHSRYRSLVPAAAIIATVLATPYARHYAAAAARNIRLNLAFPASFTTIDGVPNGWPGLLGAAHYYAFYAGPVVLALLLIFTYYFLRDLAVRQRVQHLLADRSVLALALSLGMFLIIAEALPRLLNIVILPERAWLMVVLASPVLWLAIKDTNAAASRLYYPVAAILFAATIMGALYVNSLKVHSIPNYVVASARWVGNNIPAGAVIASNRGPDLLDLYTGSALHPLADNFFCQNQARTAAELHAELQTQLPETRYLYLAAEDQRHPYAARPWHEAIPASCWPTALRTDSPYFKSVYRHGSLAGVWEIL